MPKNRFVIVFLWSFMGLLLAACNADVQPEAALSDAASDLEATAVAPTLPHPSPQAESATQPPPATSTSIPTTVPPTEVPIDLPDLGAAPDFTNEVWLNTDEPITLASVQGEKAVLVEFWTFG